MNFVSHYRGFMDRFAADPRMTSGHLAVYHALFYFWNLKRFSVPMPVSRDDVMQFARIGSIRTYTRCITDLSEWEYLRYEPTHDTRLRSRVHMYRFDKSDAQSSDKTGAQTGAQSDAHTDAHGDAQSGERPLLISIINELNEVNELNALNDYESANKNSNCIDGGRQQNAEQAGAGDHRKRKGSISRAGGGGGVPASLEEVKLYFAEKKFSLHEAEKFYNYFGSVGWTVGRSSRP